MSPRALPPLPVDELLGPLVGALERSRAAVVLAPPGAGKTTRIPPALAAAPWMAEPHRQVVLLQPRRVAARACAARIAEEAGVPLGGEVGYQIRFENRTSARTRIRVVTEGILTRQLQSDPFLEGVGCVILDEFHERSLHTDLALALLKDVMVNAREDLRVVVMSATMNPEPVARYLFEAPVLESAGRLFPVDVLHLERPDAAPLWEKAARGVERALATPEEAGHVLVFLPGMGEIRRTQGLLRAPDADVHLLHSTVPPEEQDRALAPSPRRKIILATNIAETSLTIDGVRTVVDTGMARVPFHDARLGIDRLELRRISQASARQRAGRAGRTGPGRCLRLWTRLEEASMEEHDRPELERVDLAATVLTLHAWGVADPRTFGWFEAPPPEAVARAEHLLRLLRALDSAGKVTAFGKRLAALPLHPRLGVLLLEGAAEGLLREAATLAALLSEREGLITPQERRGGTAWTTRSDVVDRLEDFEQGRLIADPAARRAIERTRDELLRLVRG